MFDFYTRFYHAVAASAANAEYCARVYGRNLCQHGFADLPHLDDLIRVARLTAGTRVLDLGCGNGMIAEYISDETGAHVTGIDFIPQAIEDARARTQPKRDRLDFRVMDMSRLDFPPASFDVIVSVDTFYFTDLVETLAGCRPLLREGGRLAAFFDQSCGPDTPLEQYPRECILPNNTDLARTLRPRGPYGRLTLANGSRLSIVEPTIHALSLQAKTLFHVNLQVRLEEVVKLDVLQSRAVYLSDLKPIEYEHQPYLGIRWPYSLDRSVAGSPLRLGGNVYDKGIGMHSQSRLTFELNGEYRRFESWVGLDDVTGQGGRVIAKVLADGVPVAGELGEISSAQGPRFVVADVAGRKKLTLVIEFGAAGDVCDHVNWCDARLIR